ncbi:MAG: hypothetical protein LWY06_19115 [Firmicutes bacterium]|nr:hypothetical protein [Bacillota bacterium]
MVRPNSNKHNRINVRNKLVYILTAALLFVLLSGSLHNHFCEADHISGFNINRISKLSPETNHHCTLCDLIFLASSVALIILTGILFNQQTFTSLYLFNSNLIPSKELSGTGSRSPPLSSL